MDIHYAKYEGGGPVQLQKGISKVLPYKTKKCRFFPRDGIHPTLKRGKLITFLRLLLVCQKGLLKDGNLLIELRLFY